MRVPMLSEASGTALLVRAGCWSLSDEEEWAGEQTAALRQCWRIVPLEQAIEDGVRVLHSPGHSRPGSECEFQHRCLRCSAGSVSLSRGHTCRVERLHERRAPISIRYPPTIDWAEAPNTLVTNGAVVSFVPQYDPSVNEAGERTNLISFSVTIGVSDSEDPPEQETQAGAFAHPQSRVCEPYPHFVRTCLSEGAVGNRYKTEVFATTFAGKRYEITLFVHSANPGCYPARTITIFDCAGIAWLFETMVSSFSPSVEGARWWVE